MRPGRALATGMRRLAGQCARSALSVQRTASYAERQTLNAERRNDAHLLRGEGPVAAESFGDEIQVVSQGQLHLHG